MKDSARFYYFAVLILAVFVSVAGGVEIEYYVGYHSKFTVGINLDTGVRWPILLRDSRHAQSDVARWNIDVAVKFERGPKVDTGVCTFSFFKSFIKPVDNQMWRRVTPQILTSDSDLTNGEIKDGEIKINRRDLPQTYLFKTSEGGMGVFKVVDKSEQRGGKEVKFLKLIYSLIKKGDSPKPSGFKINVENEADREEIEELIAKVGKAQRPAENMRVSFKTRWDYSQYTFAGERSRHESIRDSFKKIGVYDGHVFKRVFIDDGKVGRFSEGFLNLNKINYKTTFLDELFDFNDPSFFLGKGPFRLLKSSVPGIFILERIAPDSRSALQFFIDTKRGYNIVKYKRIPEGNRVRRHREYELKQYNNGLWFVSEVKDVYEGMRKDGEDKDRVIIEGVKLELNIKIDDDFFKLEKPKDKNVMVDAITRPSD